jgi:hypothetical protein
MTAKAIAFAHDKPFLAINHLEGHALSVRLTEPVEFPYLLLLVSGGHCQLLTVRGPGDFTRLGTTIDDAVGECFDKTAKLLGLGFPGGPAVEKKAQGGDAQRFVLPRPMWRKPGCDFSFSGLKTAVRQRIETLPRDDPQAVCDLCASFQRTVGDVLVDRCANALRLAPSDTLVVAGGVAANVYLRGRLEALGVPLVAPPIKLCTDNGAMGGMPAVRLLAYARNSANRVTCNRKGEPLSVSWKANMWANVNRAGHGNEFHSHPGSFWSGVYYVEDGGISADPSLEGQLEFMDPRGPGVIMYAPTLAFNVPGGLSVGANEVVLPRAGLMVLFPAWVLHQVRPYRGNAVRISVAFNLSL